MTRDEQRPEPAHPKYDFLPATCARYIGEGVYFRPIRSWHSGTFAGEQLESVNGDASGCKVGVVRGLDAYFRPYSATHRVYWHESNPNRVISAFLSYPNGMCAVGSYIWEALGPEDVERFETEDEVDAWMRNTLRPSPSESDGPNVLIKQDK